jgi:von Willebrand factor type A domain
VTRPLRTSGLVCAAVAALVVACGARTGLFGETGTTTGVARSPQFCVRAEFPSGFNDIGIYILLDKSGSMADASQWDDATAALSALVDDPTTAGLEIGLQYFPLGDECDPDLYATPAVPLDFLPANAAKIKASLAKQKVDGITPTEPALRGAISYVRSLRIADPARDIAVVLVTDGSPDACHSSTRTVVDVASEAQSAEPQVSTFVVGLANSHVDDLNRIAAAGGTGEAIFISADPSTAQKLVTTLHDVRDTQRLCRYAVPDAGAAQPTANDLSVTTQSDPEGPTVTLAIVKNAGACTSNGFYVDDPAKPKTITLCPSACATVHASTRSRVKVVVGCGEGAPDGGAIDLDAGPCHNLDFFCTPACGSEETVPPVCTSGLWTCPTGSVAADSCTKCPAAPHGCCKQDGTLATASCVSGAWVCPPGALLFGTGSCRPPEVCAASLPCAPGQYCKVPDSSCGAANVPGACAPIVATCPAENAPVCGCDGTTYGSACQANVAGIDISSTKECTPPPGTFKCGPRFCQKNSEICRKTSVLANAIGPDTYACVPQSAGCPAGCNLDPANSCSLCDACPPGRKCSFTCGTDGSGGRTLTCNVL